METSKCDTMKIVLMQAYHSQSLKVLSYQNRLLTDEATTRLLSPFIQKGLV